MWPDLQRTFANSLLAPDASAPTGMIHADQLSVYRNNVTVSLRDALEATFPVTRQLLGGAVFQEAAIAFLRRHPPQDPVLLFYGAAFPDFLENFPPLAETPYLPDVARLEWADHTAFHAADAPPLGIDCLAGVDPEALDEVTFTPHPALRLFRSDWPAVSIWAAHRPGGTLDALKSLDRVPEQAAVVRPGFEVAVHPLEAGAYAFLTALVAGAPLGVALETAMAATETDPSSLLAVVFQMGALAALNQYPRRSS